MLPKSSKRSQRPNVQIHSKRQSLPWKPYTLNRRGELRVAEEIGKKRGDLLVTRGTLGARNGGQSS